MSWGERARIKELEDEVRRLKQQLRVSGRESFLAGYRYGLADAEDCSISAWVDYQARLDKPREP